MWTNIIVLAEKWGVTPWTITGEPPTETTRQVWYERAVLYYTQINIRDAHELERLRNG